MNWIEALILGIVQGLTEFLPISSSGHLEIGKSILGIEAKESLVFTVVVHGATVLSTIAVFYQDIIKLFRGLFRFEWNEDTQYIAKIFLSMVPVGIVGLFFKDYVEGFFSSGNISFVGIMLLITALLLAFTYFAKPNRDKKITFVDSIVIGFAQACAVLPGISRAGSTIATGLLLGNNKEAVAKFSFLMVLIPILGENVLGLFSGEIISNESIGIIPLVVGFVAAFIAGFLACRWMINIVKRGRLIYFAAYCAIVGIIAIIAG